MAIYHLHCDIIGRTGGRSATAAAAYRATEKIFDRTTGETFDFTRKEKALFTQIIAPTNAPDWARDRAELWNRVEEKENRKNSQFCRSFDIALMKELTLEQNIECLTKWATHNYVERDCICDIAIHKGNKDNDNIHAHILVTTRKINAQGWTEKDRDGNDRKFLKLVRTSWADIVNAKFSELGMSERIDERTLKEQGIDREPQQHQGVKATAMARRGETPDRGKFKYNFDEIKVTEEDVLNELQNDPEFTQLEYDRDERLAIINQTEKFKNMTQPEYQKFKKEEYPNIIIKAEKESQIRWIQDHLKEIQKEFVFVSQKAEKKLKKHQEKKPSDIAKKPNKLQALMYMYVTDDGVVFSGKDYNKYKFLQQKKIDGWTEKKNELKEQLSIAREDVEFCIKKNYSEVRNSIQQRHPTLLQKMIDGARKIIEILPDFRPIRALTGAIRFLDRKSATRQRQKGIDMSRD